MNSYSRKWNTPDLIVTAGEFQKCNLDFRRMICNKIVLNLEKMPCDESWIYSYNQETEFPVEACWLSQIQEGQTEQIQPQTFVDPFFLTALAWSTCTGFPLDRQSRNTMLRFKGVQEEILSEEASTLQIGSVAFPPVHNSILITDYLTKMGIKTVPHPPYSPDLAPCDFWLFPKLRGCRYETIEEMKEAVMKVIDTLTQEDFDGAFQKFLEWYNKCIAAGGDYFDYFHVCTINKSAHTKKVWKLI